MMEMRGYDPQEKNTNPEIPFAGNPFTMKFFLSAAIHKHPVAVFFLLAYLFSWTFWLPVALVFPGTNDSALPLILVFCGTVGPLVSAVILSWFTDGKKGVQSLGQRIIHWRVGIRWYLTAFCLPPLVILSGLALFIATGHPIGVVNPIFPLYLLPLAFVFAMITGGPLAEEPGWRGFALPNLLESYSPLAASIIIGVVWSLWHLPLFFVTWSSQSGLQPGYYLLMNIGFSTLMTWIFLHTEGSVLIAMILHTSFNVAATLLPVSQAVTGSSLPLILIAIIMCAVAIIVVIARRQEFLFVEKGRFV
jgi:membrane protease YdiL (CAAX protease family)